MLILTDEIVANIPEFNPTWIHSDNDGRVWYAGPSPFDMEEIRWELVKYKNEIYTIVDIDKSHSSSLDVGTSIRVYLVKGIPTELEYLNWRGETRNRKVLPLNIWFGSNQWHPIPQWLITCIDCEDGSKKDFALSGLGYVQDT